MDQQRIIRALDLAISIAAFVGFVSAIVVMIL